MLAKSRGYTFVEVVVVLSVLMALAATASLVFRGTKDDAARSVALHEMGQIRSAVLQFRRDTGYLPKQGPFSAQFKGEYASLDGLGDTSHEHPANFGQLFENPLAGTMHPLAVWNPDTGRGWRGPYLSNRAELLVESTGPLRRVPGVADSFSVRHRTASPDQSDWMASDIDGAHPYLLLDLHQPSAARVVCTGPNGYYDRGVGDDLVLHIYQ